MWNDLNLMIDCDHANVPLHSHRLREKVGLRFLTGGMKAEGGGGLSLNVTADVGMKASKAPDLTSNPEDFAGHCFRDAVTATAVFKRCWARLSRASLVPRGHRRSKRVA